jgi:hypothetical protein
VETVVFEGIAETGGIAEIEGTEARMETAEVVAFEAFGAVQGNWASETGMWVAALVTMSALVHPAGSSIWVSEAAVRTESLCWRAFLAHRLWQRVTLHWRCLRYPDRLERAARWCCRIHRCRTGYRASGT